MKRTLSATAERASWIMPTSQPKAVSTPPVDVMMFLLSGIPSANADSFRKWATQAGLVHYVRGEGSSAINLKDFETPVPGGLRRNAHIFIFGHGSDDSENHLILLDEKSHANEESSQVMAHVLRIPSADVDKDSSTNQGYTLHWISCSSGLLRKELTPDNPLWARGTFFLYSGKKSTLLGDARPLVSGSLQYLGECKKQHRDPDPLVLFETLSHKRSDCMSVGGGTLRSMVIAHTPRGLSHITGALFTNNPNDLATNKIQGDPAALQQLASIESERRAKLTVPDVPDNEHIIRVLFKCIDHDNLAGFENMLAAQPALIDSRDKDGDSTLMVAVQLGSSAVARSLINRLNDLDTQSVGGGIALHTAIKSKDMEDEETRIEMINMLLLGNIRGIRANINAKDHAGNTPLHMALQSGSLKVSMLLFDFGADIEACNEEGVTPFMLAQNPGYERLFSHMLTQRTMHENS